MKRYAMTALFACALLALAVALSRSDRPKPELEVRADIRNPWTGLDLNNRPDDFQFALVSDRTGGHRPRIFSQAVDRLNLLQPEFVLSVGDLIEGGKKDAAKIQAERDEFDGYVKRLQMPFFYVPGNHDVGIADNSKSWDERYGRRYFHFVYKSVLFLCLDTDDPPGSGRGHLSKEQVDWARGVLAANKGVRWTLVALHKPIWTALDLPKSGWSAVEAALVDRPYTVFCGHVHRFQKFVRQGRNYYQLATTGGGSKLRGVPYGEFDQIVWVTMKKDGPVLAHLLLDSILADDLTVPASEEKGVSTASRRKTYPVRGKVSFEGTPLVGAHVVLTTGGARPLRADGYTEADGSFVLSTYTAFDGAPEGEYLVTVVCRRPLMDAVGKPGPNLLPAKYATDKTSGLKVRIQPRVNEVNLELGR